MHKEAYHASTYKKCVQSLIYEIFCPYSQNFVPSKTPLSKTLDIHYIIIVINIMLFNCCKIIVKASCGYKSLKYSY